MAYKCDTCGMDFPSRSLALDCKAKHIEEEIETQGHVEPKEVVPRLVGIRKVIREQLETLFEVQLLQYLKQPFNPKMFETLGTLIKDDKPDPLQTIERWEKLRSKIAEESSIEGLEEGSDNDPWVSIALQAMPLIKDLLAKKQTPTEAPTQEPIQQEQGENMKYPIDPKLFELLKKKIKNGTITKDEVWELIPDTYKLVITRTRFDEDFDKIKEGKE